MKKKFIYSPPNRTQWGCLPENYKPTESLLAFLIQNFISTQYFVPTTQLHNNENTVVYKYTTWLQHVSAYNGILLGGCNHRKTQLWLFI